MALSEILLALCLTIVVPFWLAYKVHTYFTRGN